MSLVPLFFGEAFTPLPRGVALPAHCDLPSHLISPPTLFSPCTVIAESHLLPPHALTAN